jgi:hypothetical protein
MNKKERKKKVKNETNRNIENKQEEDKENVVWIEQALKTFKNLLRKCIQSFTENFTLYSYISRTTQAHALLCGIETHMSILAVSKSLRH